MYSQDPAEYLLSIVVSLVPLVLFHINIYLFLLSKKKGRNSAASAVCGWKTNSAANLGSLACQNLYKKEYNPHTNTIMQAYLKT